MCTSFFSIIVPCYNQAHFLGDCISSIQSQSFTDWEVIIINDGSTDNTVEIAGQFASIDARIKLVNKPNGGLSSARNAGMAVAQGKVLQFLDADDLLLRNCLKSVSDYFAAEPQTSILRVGYQYIDEKHTHIIHQVRPSNKVFIISDVFTNNLGPCHSIFIKHDLAREIGDFDETLKSAEDWDFWIRAAKAGAIIKSISYILVAYRYVSNSMSRDGIRMYGAQKEVIMRGPKQDGRIKIHSNHNIESYEDVSVGIKRQMLMCLGVIVMQGKINEAVKLYKAEHDQFRWSVSPAEFTHMYSYLSFRYWNKNDEPDKIFNEFYPRFDMFFEVLGLSKKEHQAAMKAIFINPIRIRNRNLYGKIIGKLVNYLADKLN